jgi:hypothetical protein
MRDRAGRLMFLFSTSPVHDTKVAPAANTPVLRAIQDGAQRTGTSFDFLVKTAQRESALDPNAKAGTSSATGLFQFLDQTWLATMRGQGAQHGLGDYSAAITPGIDGRLSVADPALRQQIMEMRRDPAIASVMAGEFTQKNREHLKAVIGRDPTGGELYAAHVLGARGASELIRTMQADPDRPAVRVFPEAAAANKPIFFDRAGKARSVTEVFGVLAAAHENVSVAAAPAQSQGEAPMAALSPARQKGLIGLFSTEGNRAPISEAVTRHWGAGRPNGPDGQVRLANLQRGVSFFPRADSPANELASLDGRGSGAASTQPAPVLVGVPVVAPLPPARPDRLAVMAASDPQATQSRRKSSKLPFDLTRFQKPGARL